MSDVRDLHVHSAYQWHTQDGQSHQTARESRVPHPDDGQDWIEVRHVVAYWKEPDGRQGACQFEIVPNWDDGIAMQAVLMQVDQGRERIMLSPD